MPAENLLLYLGKAMLQITVKVLVPFHLVMISVFTNQIIAITIRLGAVILADAARRSLR